MVANYVEDRETRETYGVMERAIAIRTAVSPSIKQQQKQVVALSWQNYQAVQTNQCNELSILETAGEWYLEVL